MSDPTDSTAAVSPAARRRRLLFRLRRGVRLLEQRERIQDVGYGLLAAALALALPASDPYTTGGEVARRLAGIRELTQGLLLPIGQGLQELFDRAAPDTLMRLVAGLFFGAALMLTLAFLRSLGFRRTTTVPAAFMAFAVPYAWLGATSPVDYAAGLFGSSLVMWTLFHQEQSTARGYHWRAILAGGLAYMLHMELALIVPAIALAVARHPKYRSEASINFFMVIAVLGMSIAISLSGRGEDMRITHAIERVLAGADDYTGRTFLRWLLELPVGFGVLLFGLYQMLFAARSAKLKRAPMWIVPWCLAALAPVIAGAPEFAPIAPYLIPAGALGIADWLNRRGTAAREARWGFSLLALQIAATAIVIANR